MNKLLIYGPLAYILFCGILDLSFITGLAIWCIVCGVIGLLK